MNFIQGFLGMASGFARPLTQFVRSRWLRTLLWALALCLVIYFYGDALRLRHWQPFDTDRARLTACGVILLGWAGFNIVKAVQDRRTNAALIKAVTRGEGKDGRGDVSAQELEQMRTRLLEAMLQLRRTSGRRRGYMYQLPWYIMIGPPGSGKTTALLHSGLKFPLSGSHGREPVHGVGGTRNCDWWFTEDAILLDTAGRYTTQDSDPEMDRQGWQGFLNLLKQYRPLQPINGVIVAISLEDVATRDPAERLASAQAIRERLSELSRAFGSRFPIYVMLTKADLLAGFVQFFDAFSRTDREQVWGVTFPLDDGKPGTQSAASRFDIEFDLLLTRMNAIVLERLQQETDINRRGLIYGFPLQLATLKEPIHDILEEIFTTSKFDLRPLLRGVYIASGTQQGAPIDRLMHAMATTFGMEMPRQIAFAGQEKSYFLTRLLDAVIFAEANVVAADPTLRRRMAMTRWIASAAASLLVLGLLGTWALAYTHNRALITATNQHIGAYRKAVATIPTQNVSDTDFLRILPPLDMVRDGPAALHQSAGAAIMHGGLDQNRKLRSQYADLYNRALNNLLLPRVLFFLQQQMRNGREDDVDFKIAALRIYLGLGGQVSLDRAAAGKFMQAEWAALYPGSAHEAERADLDRHFAALLAQTYQPIALDAALIKDIQRQVQKTPLAARAYAILRDSQDAQRLPTWNVEDQAGALADRAFTRASGAPLSQGIPGFYTRDGYLSVVLPGLRAAVSAVSREQWAYGKDTGSQSEDAIAAQTVALYRDDFTARWTPLLADLRIRRLTDLQQSVIVLTALAGPDSVLMKLLQAIVRDTDLSPPAAKARDAEAQRFKVLVAGDAPDAAEAEQPFAALRAAMQSQDGRASQIGELMRTINTLYEEVSRAGGSPRGVLSITESESGLNDANQKLISQSRLVPPPVDVWLSDLSASVTSVTSGTARSAISEAWNASDQRFCLQATRGRYPFAHLAQQEISVDDFTRLFGPGGTMESFFGTNLAKFVSTSHHPWRWQYNGAQGVSSAFLSQFEHAQAIRQAFFSGNGTASFHYDITPDRLDPNANSMTLDIGGQLLSYAHGPLRPTTMTWPAGDAGARLSVQPPVAGGTLALQGVWAPFRLLDQASVEPTGPDRLRAVFSLGARSLSLDVKSDGVLNPFTLRDVRAFRCPGTL